MLRPEPLPDGTDPEERLIICGLSWQRYLDLDKAPGDDRPGPRFYRLDGDLEIMPRGQATLRLALKEAGAEPDESWCLGEAKKFPDLVLEIALTSGGVSKLEVYRCLAVPEVWLWRRNGLEIFALRADGSAYERVSQSRLLPQLDVALLERCVTIASWREARRAFRAGLAAGK
ncbi:MAG: Uma2 family endonuclease [Verrucomicrobia bacterium]|nr:Uma2 family endonuclease [Verrucomicrobiota bacterium]